MYADVSVGAYLFISNYPLLRVIVFEDIIPKTQARL